MHVIFRTSRRVLGTATSFALVSAAMFALGAAGCASSKSSASSAGGGPKPTANLITADEISHVTVQNAYEVVQKLRPSMLRQRQLASVNGQGGVGQDGAKAPVVTGSGVTSGEVVVYMDGTRLGDADQLRGISASSIAFVRYYTASEAQTKWGSGHPGGAIEVTTKR